MATWQLNVGCTSDRILAARAGANVYSMQRATVAPYDDAAVGRCFLPTDSATWRSCQVHSLIKPDSSTHLLGETRIYTSVARKHI